MVSTESMERSSVSTLFWYSMRCHNNWIKGKAQQRITVTNWSILKTQQLMINTKIKHGLIWAMQNGLGIN